MSALEIACPKCGSSAGRRCLGASRLADRVFMFAPKDTPCIVRVEAAGLVSIISKTSPHRKRRSR